MSFESIELESPVNCVPRLHADTLSDLSDDNVTERLTTLAAHIAAAEHELLVLIAEVDRRRIWAAHGCKSCSHWLSWKCGMQIDAARERIRVARALESLPQISAAFSQAELSYSKARALSRVATADNEGELLDVARFATGSQTERIVQAFRTRVRNDELDKNLRQQDERSLYCAYNDDGMMVLRACLPPDVGARVKAAIATAIDAELAKQPLVQQSEADREAGLPGIHEASRSARDMSERMAQRRADALVRICDAWATSNEDSATHHTNKTERPPRDAVIEPSRYEVVVHIDAAVLAQKYADTAAPGRSELDDGPTIAAETVRRLCCDSKVVPLVENEQGTPLDIGHASRVVPAPMRRALHARDRGCRFPGCGSEHRLHAHHIIHWANGGATKLSNLIELCHFHHRLVHEGGFSVANVDGTHEFRDPTGRILADGVTVLDLERSGWHYLEQLRAAH